MYQFVSVAVSAADYAVLSGRVVRDEHGVLWAVAEHERVRDQCVSDYGECFLVESS